MASLCVLSCTCSIWAGKLQREDKVL
jgi:hypothetical protein